MKESLKAFAEIRVGKDPLTNLGSVKTSGMRNKVFSEEFLKRSKRRPFWPSEFMDDGIGIHHRNTKAFQKTGHR
jgi:hypothetical protein